jgi:CheY-like chemotaxis protein
MPSVSSLDVEFSKSGIVVASGTRTPTPKRQPLTILVVDDCVLNRKMLIKSLQLDCHTCYEADNGMDAMSLMIQYRVVTLERHRSQDRRGKQHIKLKGLGDATVIEKFDVVLMDSDMPQMSGPEAASEMRKIGYTGVIIAVTGDTNLENNAEFLIEGADEVLHKPVSREKLNETLDRLVYAKRAKKHQNDLDRALVDAVNEALESDPELTLSRAS